jgi:predicted Zn-dependent protease with MMP-like domain
MNEQDHSPQETANIDHLPFLEEEQEEQDETRYDYNREPPLDTTTINQNKSRSRYVFMTLCFLVSLMLFAAHFNNTFASDTANNWFPLVGATVMAIVGLGFLLSPGNTSEPITASPEEAPSEDTPQRGEEMPLSSFEKLIQEALASIPEEFQEHMNHVTVHAEYEPSEDVLARMHVTEGHTLLGLYQGVPLTSYGYHEVPYPEIITIYQHPIEVYCQHDPERIRAQVRATVLHEVAHHFGIDHAEMPIWLQ